MTDHRLTDFIVVLPNVISKEMCEEIIELYAGHPEWKWAETVGGVDLDWRKVRELPLSAEAVRAQDPRYAEMDKRLFEVFSRAKNMYVEDIMKRLNTPHTPDIQSDEGYHLLHYPEGYYFKEHADDARGMGRVLTCTLNLSDDHEGGRFKFLKGALDLHLRAGEAVLFPASFMFPHEVTKITRGERYSIVTWFK